jgi:hypothetical protein
MACLGVIPLEGSSLDSGIQAMEKAVSILSFNKIHRSIVARVYDLNAEGELILERTGLSRVLIR